MFRNRISALAAGLALALVGGLAGEAQAQVYVVGYPPPAPVVIEPTAYVVAQPAYVAPYYYAAYAPVYVRQPVVYTAPVVVPGPTYLAPVVRPRVVRTRTRGLFHHSRVVTRTW
jgi:hypothetical protein